MNLEELQRALKSFSSRQRVAYLVGCIQHVSPPICAVYGEHSSIEIVNKAIDLAWDYVVDGTVDEDAVAEISSSMDSLLNEDSPTALVYIAAAIELVVASIVSSEDVVAKVMNNIEAAIDTIDEEPDIGTDEEKQWQENAFEIVRKLEDISLIRKTFSELSASKSRWITRVIETAM